MVGEPQGGGVVACITKVLAFPKNAVAPGWYAVFFTFMKLVTTAHKKSNGRCMNDLKDIRGIVDVDADIIAIGREEGDAGFGVEGEC